MAGRYDFPYTDDSTYGRAVRLVGAHARSGGVVVDLGCGRGVCAGPLRSAGHSYVGLDADADSVAALRGDGIEAGVVDLADAGGLAGHLDAAVGERPVAAVTMLDCIEHLAAPARTLDALAAWCASRDDPLVVVSVPNVAHVDLGIKLLSGRWDITEVGLLDSTHLAWFTEERVETEFASRGWVELGREDVVIPRSEQEAPPGHPFWGPGSSVEASLRWLRRCADGNGDTYQFVRAYRRQPAPVAPPVPVPALSAVVRVADRADGLAELLARLAAQDRDDFEVVLSCGPEASRATGAVLSALGPPLAARTRLVTAAGSTAGEVANAGIGAATGRYVAVLELGQSVTPGWARCLGEAAGSHPGRVVRAPGAGGAYNPAVQFRRNQLPLATFALPRSLCRPGAVWFPARPGPEADWAFATAAAMAAGVVDLPGTAIVSASGADGGPADALAEGLLPAPVLMPVASAGVLVHELGLAAAEADRLGAALDAAEAARDDALRLVGAMRASHSWRLTAPLRWATVTARTARRRLPRPG